MIEDDYEQHQDDLQAAEDRGALFGWICGLVLGGMVGWASCWVYCMGLK